MAAGPYSPFDQIADSYDRSWTDAPSGSEQRRAVWRAIDPYFRGLRTALDLGCGTGTDALHLASLGVSTYAVDSSSAMVAQARSRGVDAHQLSIEKLDSLPLKVDGALSNFGAFNCVRSLVGAAASLTRLVRQGGPLALCLIGPLCLWETVHYLATGNIRKAFRRLHGTASSSLGVTVHYPSHDAVLSAFQIGFRLVRFEGIGLCVPPSYVPASQSFVRRAAAVDRSLAHRPLFRMMADHRLYLFERL
jgi:SAM-dependent methyltransferase